MEAVRKRTVETASDDMSASLPVTNRKMRELRETDLRTISMYRQQTKHEDIAHHLMSFITREVNIRLMPGYVEFFEFVLQNPYPEQHSISIACDDDELRYSHSFFLLLFNLIFCFLLVLLLMLVNGVV
jgi:nephrocystin-4